MSAHTPGPWVVQDGKVDIHTFRDGRTSAIHLATCSWHQLPGGVHSARANARLIAAAPDLLAALSAIIEQWDAETKEMVSRIHPSWGNNIIVNTHPLKVQAKNAIAKANGEPA